tara:strand:- start:1 stop:216 length:216 start_codon:yes stop_codon:yes gene_type:complete
MKNYKIGSEILSLSGWADKMGVSRAGMSKRIAKLEKNTSLSEPEKQRQINKELQRPKSQGRRADTNATSAK